MKSLTLWTAAVVLAVVLAGSGWAITFEGSDIRLNDTDGTVGSDSFGLVSVGSSVVAAWIDYRSGTDEVYCNWSADGGANWQANDTRVSFANLTCANLVVVGDGTYAYLGWLEDHWNDTRRDDFAFRRLNPSTGTWGALTYLDDGAWAEDDAMDPTLAMGGAGIVYASWKSYHSVVFRLSTDSGATWQPVEEIDYNYSEYPSVAADGNGDPIYWYGDYNFQPPDTFMVRKGTRSGNTVSWSEPATVSTITQRSKITADDANAYAFWWENTNVGGKQYGIYTTASEDLGQSFNNPKTMLTAGGYVDKATYRVGNDGAGDVFIAWSEDNRINFRRSVDTGGSWESTVAMTAYTSGYPGMVVGDSGQLALTYQDSRTENDKIFCRFSPDSADSWSGELRVDGKSVDPSGDQRNQAMAFGPDHLFVTWREYRPADGGNNIYFNRAGLAASPTPSPTPEGYKTPTATPSAPPTASPTASPITTPILPTPVGGNLLDNPGFESWTSDTYGSLYPDDWSVDYRVDVERESGVVHSGSYSASFSNWTTPPGVGAGVSQSWLSPVIPGEDYTFSAWVYSQAPGTMGLGGRWYSETGYYTYWTNTVYSTTSGQWELLQVTNTAIAGTTQARVDIWGKRPSLGFAGYGDDASFYKGQPVKTPVPTPPQAQGAVVGDYNGDGTSDIAVFRPSAGLWLIRNVTRAYFGASTDQPVPQDYNGNGAWDIAVFKAAQSKWMVRNGLTAWYGAATDTVVPADYSGNGTADIAVFRASNGLWLVRGLTRAYFGASTDTAVPADYNGNGTTDVAVFKSAQSKWMVRNGLTAWYGAATDTVVPADYSGNGTTDIAVFRASNGLWLVRGLTRAYFGGSTDIAIPADYNGDGVTDIAVFKAAQSKWMVRNGLTAWYGAATDTPVTNPYPQ